MAKFTGPEDYSRALDKVPRTEEAVYSEIKEFAFWGEADPDDPDCWVALPSPNAKPSPKRDGTPGTFIQYVCPTCRSNSFQVFSTDAYETSMKCNGCGLWMVVHSG